MSIREAGIYKGVEERDIQKRQDMRRDPRRVGEKIMDFLSINEVVMFIILCAAVLSVVFPFFLLFSFLLSFGMYKMRIGRIRRSMLPARMPMSSKRADKSDPIPGTKDKKHFKAGGIFHVGNERNNDQEVWLADKDVLTHFLIFGTTGAGKALPLDEDVLTPLGFKKMGDIAIGDEVISIDGQPTLVKGVYPQGSELVYKIMFEDGREVEASSEHLWEVNIQGSPVILTTQQLMDNMETNRFSVKLSRPVDPIGDGSIYEHLDLNSLKELMIESLVPDSTFGTLSIPKRKVLFDCCVEDVKKGKNTSSFFVKRTQVIGWSLGYNVSIVNNDGLFSIEGISNEVNILSIKPSRMTETVCIKVEHQRSLFLTRNYIPTHNTETLVSLAFNAIALGSGMFYVDPKAAPKLAFQIYVMSRILGREHDFLVINYSVKSKSPYRYNPKRITNTVNPFSAGSAEALSELLTALIPASEGDNAVFSNGAQTMIKALMYGLVEKRNKKEIPLSIATIRKYTALTEYIELATDKGLTTEARGAMQGYLNSVGWKEGMPSNKLEGVSKQHGFSLSYFSLALANLTDTYGHIYLRAKGELNNMDVIKYRRIAVVMLPALEMSPPQLKNVGQITLSAVRNATSIGLGERLEGTVEDVIDALPTNSPVPGVVLPFISVTDEYAAIPTPGYAEVLTQGRGLGIAAIVASQDYAGIKGADEKGAKQIVANTKFKMVMAMDDPEDTWELFEKISGQVEVAVTGGFDSKESTFGNYRDSASVSIEKRAMIDIKDLQSQIEGEFHGFFKGKLIRGQTFYANPPLPKKMALKINHKIGIEDIDKKVIDTRYGRIKDMTDSIGTLLLNGGISKIGIMDRFDFSDKQEKTLKALRIAFKDSNDKSRSDKAIIGLMLTKQMTRDAESPVESMRKRQEEALSKNKESSSEEVESDLPFTSKSSNEDSDDAMSDLPFGGKAMVSDTKEEEEELDLIRKENPKRAIQRKVISNVAKGGHILSSQEEQKKLKSEVVDMERKLNPKANVERLEGEIDHILGVAASIEDPLPNEKKDEGKMLTEISGVQKILASVKAKQES